MRPNLGRALCSKFASSISGYYGRAPESMSDPSQRGRVRFLLFVKKTSVAMLSGKSSKYFSMFGLRLVSVYRQYLLDCVLSHERIPERYGRRTPVPREEGVAQKKSDIGNICSRGVGARRSPSRDHWRQRLKQQTRQQPQKMRSASHHRSRRFRFPLDRSTRLLLFKAMTKITVH